MGVSTLHTFKNNIVSPTSSMMVTTITEGFMRRAFQDPAGYLGYWPLMI
jgi:hypothetical protein